MAGITHHLDHNLLDGIFGLLSSQCSASNRIIGPQRMPSQHLMDFATFASDAMTPRDPAPVHLWDPPYCGDLDIVIRRDGSWFHEGRPIRRRGLVQLFSSILKKEDNRYYLVTPVEKVGITVEDCPFIIVEMDVSKTNGVQVLTFSTNTDEQISADSFHRLSVGNTGGVGSPHPTIHVRNGLHGLLSRAVFYRLCELSVEHQCKQTSRLGVFSSGIFFPLD